MGLNVKKFFGYAALVTTLAVSTAASAGTMDIKSKVAAKTFFKPICMNTAGNPAAAKAAAKALGFTTVGSGRELRYVHPKFDVAFNLTRMSANSRSDCKMTFLTKDRGNRFLSGISSPKGLHLFPSFDHPQSLSLNKPSAFGGFNQPDRRVKGAAYGSMALWFGA